MHCIHYHACNENISYGPKTSIVIKVKQIFCIPSLILFMFLKGVFKGLSAYIYGMIYVNIFDPWQSTRQIWPSITRYFTLIYIIIIQISIYPYIYHPNRYYYFQEARTTPFKRLAPSNKLYVMGVSKQYNTFNYIGQDINKIRSRT